MSEEAPSNVTEFTVSELASNLKRTVETAYDHVRVRGELGRVTIARSGHMYADIKDEKAVLNTVMWKGSVNRLPFKPEEGLEVVAEGKLSIYPGRSNYQLIADFMRPAGAGALMALLEERKKKFAAEGLFDEAHKKTLPYLPHTVGVVTSPTGAVIRDILHRIRERFPVRVILWPALVQGDTAAAQIEAGIRGFNAMTGEDRPDVLIVGRGGGSIEDLWPFNEENVVRAAFESEIPLISAVGHETDTTLIDYVSDARAPTPTGAAEIAVPVRQDLMIALGELGQSLTHGLSRMVRHDRDRLRAARLPKLETLIAQKRQTVDYLEAHLRSGLSSAIKSKRIELTRTEARLRPEPLQMDARRWRQRLGETAVRAKPALRRIIADRRTALAAQAKLLDTLSYQATLDRGFAIVKDEAGNVLKSASKAEAGDTVSISLADGTLGAEVTGKDKPSSTPGASQKPKPAKPAPKPADPPKGQGSLF
ncbi:exodeoxyribonuclease VII large subunit [Henriciella aquimarina]|uniref:exodeoxyribonuclease VII large subunit n=1 Tax=Henriciella aquimarina TaxID=545261 RepID=UPI000A0611D8|nr:exodeoxyribonuclease VII large subunit [Henriciella aquimarina]